MSKNGHIGLHIILTKHLNQLYYNSSKENYITLNTTYIKIKKFLIHVLQISYQSHNPAFFSKAASNERHSLEHSLYLK